MRLSVASAANGPIYGAAVGSTGRLEMNALPRQEYGKLS
jgi:hypothetical protein